MRAATAKPATAKAVAAILVALALAYGAVAPARAQTPEYPNGKITFIVGFAPGGVTDIVARAVGQKLYERLGQQVVVDNLVCEATSATDSAPCLCRMSRMRKSKRSTAGRMGFSISSRLME